MFGTRKTLRHTLALASAFMTAALFALAAGGGEATAGAEPLPAAPSLSVTVEPSENGAVVYLPVAPKAAGQSPEGLLALRLSIKNNGDAPVHLNKVELSFVGPPAVADVSIAADRNINKGATTVWTTTFDGKNKVYTNIHLPSPAPSSFKLRLYCDGFDAPAESSHRLVPHKSPTPQGSYLFPARSSDLLPGEYWSARSDAHANGSQGSQLFAYDMGVAAYDPIEKKWSGRRSGTTGKKNEDYLIWGKPVYAMADGVVLGCRNDVPNNSMDAPEDPSAFIQSIPGNQISGGGNFFRIQHGDEVLLYAHMQMGSLTQSLCKEGATVKAGDKLGLAGNSGSSSAPHLHIHVVQSPYSSTAPLRPLPFRNIYSIARSDDDPTPDGPWVKVSNQGPPMTKCLIWPSTMAPGTQNIKALSASSGNR